jgi:macrodomain Ter protein organizer (MatP/YcbG family)
MCRWSEPTFSQLQRQEQRNHKFNQRHRGYQSRENYEDLVSDLTKPRKKPTCVDDLIKKIEDFNAVRKLVKGGKTSSIGGRQKRHHEVKVSSTKKKARCL